MNKGRCLGKKKNQFRLDTAAQLILLNDILKFIRYFSRMNTLMGVPWKSQCSRILFSR